MKKIIFLLLCTVSFYGQTLQNPTYGTVTVKNSASDTTPAYFVTSQTDGVYKKTPAATVEKTANKQNSLAVDGTGTKYPTVDAVNNAKNTVNGLAGLDSSLKLHIDNLPDYLQPISVSSLVDVLTSKPTSIGTFENIFIPLTENTSSGNTYKMVFKLLNVSSGSTETSFSILIQQSGGVYQYIWTNHLTVVGETYVVYVVSDNIYELLHLYCGSFGGDIEISFEKLVSNNGNNYNLQKLAQPFKGQKIAWFGTSIPTGTPDAVTIDGYSGQNKYPSMVAQLTGTTVSNEGVGGSRISTGIPSAYDSVTDPLGIGNNIQGSFGFYSSLSQTIAEKDYIFDNWATIYPKFQDAGSLTSTCPKTKEQLRDYSFERKLIANYLTNDGAKIFVLDHGFNDMFKIAMSDGQAVPIQGSTTERMYYSGAMNYIIRKIYESDPRNKIVMITHYRKGEPDLDKLYDTQRKIADYWQIPLVSLADLMSINSISINTQGYWNSSYIWQNVGYTFTDLGGSTFSTNDYGPQRNWSYSDYITYATPHQVVGGTDEALIYPVGTWIHKDSRLNFFCPDNVHPHSDLSGISNMTIAKILASEFNNGFQQSKAFSFYNATLTGTPTAPTAPVGTNTDQLATTAFVQAAVAKRTFSITFSWATGGYAADAGVYYVNRESTAILTPTFSLGNATSGVPLPFNCKIVGITFSHNVLASTDLQMRVYKVNADSTVHTQVASKLISGRINVYTPTTDYDTTATFNCATENVSIGFLNPTTSTGNWRSASITILFQEL